MTALDPTEFAAWRRGFLLRSILAAVIIGGVVALATVALSSDASLLVAGTAVMAAAATSTGGWLIVISGLAKDPKRMPGYFGAGMLLKLVLVGGVAAGCVVAGVPLERFLVPFAVALLLVGFAQLALVASLSNRLAQAAATTGEDKSAH